MMMTELNEENVKYMYIVWVRITELEYIYIYNYSTSFYFPKQIHKSFILFHE